MGGPKAIKEKQAKVQKMKKRIDTLERQIRAASMERDRLEQEMTTKRKVWLTRLVLSSS